MLSNYPGGPEREREKRRFEHARHRVQSRASCSRSDAAPELLPTLPPLVAADAAHRDRARATDQADGGARRRARASRFARGKNGGWGFAGLDKQAEDDKNRAYHDLEVVRASAADYERAAARARRNDPQAGRAARGAGETEGSSRCTRGALPGRGARAGGRAACPPPSPTPAPAPRPSRRPRRRPPPAAPRIYARRASSCGRRALTLESRFADVRVEGEVSGLKRSGPGHLYFCLKDEEAQLDCVMFSREAARLKFTLEEGMAVRCRGRLTLYEARGKFQMTVAEIEPTGAGALALAFEQLKKRLGAEGLFDPARKRPLPFLPRRLGVVTSAQGAVIRDIIRVAHRRFPVPILLAPDAGAGRRRRAGDRGGAAAPGGGRRRRRHHRRARRRLAGGPVGLQRGAGGARHRRLPRAGDLGRRARDRLHHRRLRRRPARARRPSAAAELARAGARTTCAPSWRCCAGAAAARSAESAARARATALERARARLGDPRRLLDERRQRLDEQVERGRRVLRRRLGRPRAPSCAPPRCASTAPTRSAASSSSARALAARAPPAGGRRCARRSARAATPSRPRAASWTRCRRSRCSSAASA